MKKCGNEWDTKECAQSIGYCTPCKEDTSAIWKDAEFLFNTLATWDDEEEKFLVPTFDSE